MFLSWAAGLCKTSSGRMRLVFYAVCAPCAAAALAGLCGGVLEPGRLFFSNRWDLFMDFFNPVVSSLAHTATLYPPLAVAGYAGLGKLLPAQAWQAGAESLRAGWAGTALFAGYFVLTTAFLCLLVMRLKKGGVREKSLFAAITVFSAPFLFQFERANLILPVLILMLLFLAGKDSSRVWVRQGALWCLAAAAACKFYPAALGVLLLREKRWRDILLLGLYVFVLLAAPAFLFGGPEEVYRRLWKQMVMHVNWVRRFSGFGYMVGISNTLTLCAFWAGLKTVPVWAGQAAGYAALAAGAPAAWFARKTWRAVALACCLMALVPEMSYFYSLILLFPALFMLLDAPGERSALDWACLALFMIIWAPVWFFALPETWYRGYLPLYGETLVCRFAALLLFVLLTAAGWTDGARRLIQWVKKYNINKENL